MKKTLIISYLFLFAFAGSLFANEVNIFSARHYDSDVQLYEKFTAKTGIKVNVVSGKSGALEKRIIEEGADSQADLYITADAGRLGAFEANLQGGLTSAAIKSAVPPSAIILFSNAPDFPDTTFTFIPVLAVNFSYN